MRFIVIGISDAPKPFIQPEVMRLIQNSSVFSGGKRHRQIMSPQLPKDAVWIDITVPLEDVFSRYNTITESDIVVFASGDPLFYGFANTLKRVFPEAEITVYPTFNSLQLLAHRLIMPYHDMQIVSLTGRDWTHFDQALLSCAHKIGVLTDKTHTPSAIAERMLYYGYKDYQMYVGEHLGNPTEERISTLCLEEAAEQSFTMPNCSILVGSHRRRFGLPDEEFQLLDGREKMITKMPIRLLSLQRLDLSEKHTFWDIGFCTGSVSIEARTLFPHLKVVAFEIREEGRALMEANSRRFGTPGIDVHIGDFLCQPIETLPPPDAVFIGGHGGRLKEIMEKVNEVLADGGCMVMNSVTSAVVEQSTHRAHSKEVFVETCHRLGLLLEAPLKIQLNNYNSIEILKCRKQPSSR